MKFIFIKTTYPLLFTLILTFLFPHGTLADLSQKSFIEKLLENRSQDKTVYLCHNSQPIVSNSKNDFTHPMSKSAVENQDRSFKNPCSQQAMKPLQKLLILPPFFEANTEAKQNLTDRRKVWEILRSRFIQNKQLKVVSWEKMHHLLRAHPNFHQYEITFQETQDEKMLELARLADADAYLTISVNTQKMKTQVYSIQDGGLLWEDDNHHTSDHNLESLEQHINTMAKNFIESFPYHAVQILDPLWKEVILEKDFQNLAKVDVGSNSSIQEGDSVFWIEVCRTNKNPLFINGGRAYILAKGKVLKKERGILLTNITQHRAELNNWREKIHEGTLVVSLDENSSPIDQDTVPTKNKAEKTKSRLTLATGVLSILVLLAVLL